MMKFKDRIIKFLSLDKFYFEEIFINKVVINQVIELAKRNYPREFLAYLKGDIKNKKLMVNELMYQPYKSSSVSAHTSLPFTIVTDAIGTVHSHPSYSNNPSSADMNLFGKQGNLHLIVCRPFDLNSIRAYDKLGNVIRFKIE